MTLVSFNVILVELSGIIVSDKDTIQYNFWKEKNKLRKCLTTYEWYDKVIKSLEQSRQSQIRRTVPKSGRVRKTLKKLEKSSWQSEADVIK